MPGMRSAWTVALTIGMLGIAMPARPCGFRATHRAKLVLVMTSELAISSGSRQDIPLLALAGQLRGTPGGPVLSSCVLAAGCVHPTDPGRPGCDPSDNPIDTSTSGFVAAAPACLGSRLLQPVCSESGAICRNNRDCPNGGSDDCTCVGATAAVPFEPVAGDPRIADAALERGTNIICYQCDLDRTAIGLPSGTPFFADVFVNMGGGSLRMACPENTCDGDADGAMDAIVRTKLIQAADLVP